MPLKECLHQVSAKKKQKKSSLEALKEIFQENFKEYKVSEMVTKGLFGLIHHKTQTYLGSIFNNKLSAQEIITWFNENPELLKNEDVKNALTAFFFYYYEEFEHLEEQHQSLFSFYEVIALLPTPSVPLEEKDFSAILSSPVPAGIGMGHKFAELLLYSPERNFEYLDKMLDQKAFLDNDIIVFTQCLPSLEPSEKHKLILKLISVAMKCEVIRLDILTLLTHSIPHVQKDFLIPFDSKFITFEEFLAKIFLNLFSKDGHKNEPEKFYEIFINFLSHAKLENLSSEILTQFLILFFKAHSGYEAPRNLLEKIHFLLINSLSCDKTIDAISKGPDKDFTDLLKEAIIRLDPAKKTVWINQLIEFLKPLKNEYFFIGKVLYLIFDQLSPLQQHEAYQLIKQQLTNPTALTEYQARTTCFIFTAYFEVYKIKSEEAAILYSQVYQLEYSYVRNNELSFKAVALGLIAKNFDPRIASQFWKAHLTAINCWSRSNYDLCASLFKMMTLEDQINLLNSMLPFVLNFKANHPQLPFGTEKDHIYGVFSFVASKALSSDTMAFLKPIFTKQCQEITGSQTVELSQFLSAFLPEGVWNLINSVMETFLRELYDFPKNLEAKHSDTRKEDTQEFYRHVQTSQFNFIYNDEAVFLSKNHDCLDLSQVREVLGIIYNAYNKRIDEEKIDQKKRDRNCHEVLASLCLTLPIRTREDKYKQPVSKLLYRYDLLEILLQKNNIYHQQWVALFIEMHDSISDLPLALMGRIIEILCHPLQKLHEKQMQVYRVLLSLIPFLKNQEKTILYEEKLFLQEQFNKLQNQAFEISERGEMLSKEQFERNMIINRLLIALLPFVSPQFIRDKTKDLVGRLPYGLYILQIDDVFIHMVTGFHNYNESRSFIAQIMKATHVEYIWKHKEYVIALCSLVLRIHTQLHQKDYFSDSMGPKTQALFPPPIQAVILEYLGNPRLTP